MSTSPSEQHKAEQEAGKDDLVQYVEELAGPKEYPEGDAWISLTDAARITRTSEAMARRWVTSGRLKVKKEPVGAYTGRFFRMPFSLYPCPHDGPPCSCVVSPAVVPAVSSASAAWPQATDVLEESALATILATSSLVAMPPLARPLQARTAVRA